MKKPPFLFAMNVRQILTIVVIGLSGLIAQVLVMRELLVAFYGNELTVGLIIFFWMLLEAAGVYAFAQRKPATPDELVVFLGMELFFIASLLFSAYAARTCKVFLGLAFGSGINLAMLALITCAVTLPAAFCHGALFSLGCGLFSRSPNKASGLSAVYAWEIAGSMAAGLLFTFLLVPFFGTFFIVYFVCLLNLLVVAVWIPRIAVGRQRGMVTLTAVVFGLFFLLLNPQTLERRSLGLQYRPLEIIDQRNSPYGSLVLTTAHGEKTLFYNGLPAVTLPVSDVQSNEEFGHLPLAFHPAPHSVLVISAGLGGLLREILKHPIARIDYLELDPAITKMLVKYGSPAIAGELTDSRLHVYHEDGRSFVRRRARTYDVIVVGLSQIQDLVSNRFFTAEFFREASAQLNKGGILALRLPGSAAYLGRPLQELNSSVVNALKGAFAYVRVIPGEYNLIFASDSIRSVSADEAAVIERLEAVGIDAVYLSRPLLAYRFDRGRQAWFNALLKVRTPANRDFLPYALFQSLRDRAQQFNPLLFRFSSKDARIPLQALGGLILFLGALAMIRMYLRQKGVHTAVFLFIGFSSGFSAMLSNLVLILGYQVRFGFFYSTMALVIALFMAGSATAGFFVSRILERKMIVRLWPLVTAESMLAVSAVFIAWVALPFFPATFLGAAGYGVLFFACGFFLGLEFPLMIVLTPDAPPAQTAARVYAADLIGGCCAGLAATAAIFPFMGLAGTVAITLVLKTMGVVLLAALTQKCFSGKR